MHCDPAAESGAVLHEKPVLTDTPAGGAKVNFHQANSPDDESGITGISNLEEDVIGFRSPKCRVTTY